MGKGSILKNMPLKKQLTFSIVGVILLSAVFTIITAAGIVYLSYYAGYNMYPANYYEKKIPEVVKYIVNNNDVIMDKSSQKAIEKVIPLKGMDYQVMDISGVPVYGSMMKRLIIDRKQLLYSLNSRVTNGRTSILLYPVIGSGGGLKGAIALRYRVEAGFDYKGYQLGEGQLTMLFLIIPFFYIIIFTVIFVRIIGRNMLMPVGELVKAFQSVKNRDLDFKIGYDGENELGQLCCTFESMRSELESSLKREWNMYQKNQEMFAAIAHDIRTPVAIIKGHAEALIDGGAKHPERISKYLEIIDSNAARIIKLVSSVNEASEAERYMEMNPEETDIEEFMKDKCQEYSMLVLPKNIKVIYCSGFNEKESIKYTIDKEEISRVLDNIFSNSMHYTPDGGSIEIKTFKTEDGIGFNIHDSGEGFKEKDYEAVFEKFYRSEEARTGEKGHCGLGLYIAKEIIKRHGGSITAYNSEDGGACIEFTIGNYS